MAYLGPYDQGGMQWVIAAPLDLDHSARLVGGAGGAVGGVVRGTDAYGK